MEDSLETNPNRIAVIDSNCEIDWTLLNELQSLEIFAMLEIIAYEKDEGVEFGPCTPVPAFRFYHDVYASPIPYMFFTDPKIPRLNGDNERKFVPLTAPAESTLKIIPLNREYLYHEFGNAIDFSQLPDSFYWYRGNIAANRRILREEIDHKVNTLKKLHSNYAIVTYRA